MAAPSVTYQFVNGQTSDGPQVSQNFTDIVNALTDGTSDVTIGTLTLAAGTATSPAIRWPSPSNNTGIYLKAADSVGFSANGTECGFYSSGGAWTFGIANSTLTHTLRGSTVLQTESRDGLVTLYVQNSSNTSSANALVDVEVAGTSAANAFIRFSDTVTYWVAGARLNSSNQFVVAQSTALGGSNEFFTITTAGVPAFPSHGTTADAANANLNSSTGVLARSTSSARYKKDIKDIEIDTSKLYDLRVVEFKEKNTDLPYFGLIAEEVYELFPELVWMHEGQPDSVKYPLISVLLLNEMKKLKEIVDGKS